MDKPSRGAVIGTLAVAVVAFLLQRISPLAGYFLALLSMLMIIVASYTNAFWPSRNVRERPVIFCLFWGLMLGLVLPFAVLNYQDLI